MRFAFGSVPIECSTYSRVRSGAADFRVLNGQRLAEAPEFDFLRSYPFDRSLEWAPSVIFSARSPQEPK
jgi:hypothetical protein